MMRFGCSGHRHGPPVFERDVGDELFGIDFVEKRHADLGMLEDDWKARRWNMIRSWLIVGIEIL
jgi:hypothetical protein